MSDEFDKSSTLKIDGEVLNRSSFKKTSGNKLARRIGNESDDPVHVKSKQLIQGVDYDTITASYPNTTTEIYDYTLLGVLKLKVTAIYLTVSKKDILTVTFV